MLDRITAPTLLIQGTQDSLFGLGQADANARGSPRTARRSRSSGTPAVTTARLRPVTAQLRDQVAGWFDWYLRAPGPIRAPASPSPRPPAWAAGRRSACRAVHQTEVAARYPGLDRRGRGADDGDAERAGPAGGHPARRHPGRDQHAARPRLAGRGARRDQLDIPGQFAAFDGRPLTAAVDVVGAPG